MRGGAEPTRWSCLAKPVSDARTQRPPLRHVNFTAEPSQSWIRQLGILLDPVYYAYIQQSFIFISPRLLNTLYYPFYIPSFDFLCLTLIAWVP